MKKILLAAASALILTACDTSGTKTMTASTFDASVMDDLLKNAVDTQQTHGVSAVVYQDGVKVYQGAFGLRDAENNLPMNEDTIVRIYSMTKPITSTIIMQMVEEGKIKLSDPAAKYIPQIGKMMAFEGMSEDGTPNFAPQARPITVEDLMLHTSGIGYGIFGDITPLATMYKNAGLFNPDETMAQNMDKLAALPLMAQPGDIWYYGYNIDVLGRIAETIDGKPLGEVMQDRIFGPLGMTKTGFSVPAGEANNFASNYMMTPDGLVLAEAAQGSPFQKANAYQSGGGGLVSTLGDYAKYGQAMANGGELGGVRILKSETVSLMMENHLDDSVTYAFPWDQGGAIRFGYGGSVAVSADEALTCESGIANGQWGWGGAARTDFFIDPDAGTMAVFFVQQFQEPEIKLHADFRRTVWMQTRKTNTDWCAEE